MDWLNVMLDAANVALNASQLKTMNELSQMQQIGALTEAVQSVMRDYVFRINQTQEDLLFYQERNPIAVASGLRYLELELQNSGIKPEFFPQLGDKDYFAKTRRTIKQAFIRISESLPPEQRDRIEAVAEALGRKDDVTFLVENYDKGIALQNAQNTMRSLEENKPGVFSFNEQGEWNKQYARTKREIAQLTNQIDLEMFQVLVQRYGITTYEDCEKQYDAIFNTITTVFQDVPVPQLPIDGENAVEPVQAKSTDATASDRSECVECGYFNSKHRVTCKKCRAPLA